MAKISKRGTHLATGGKSGVLKIFEIINYNSDHLKEFYDPSNISSYLNFFNEIPYRAYTEHTNDIIDICWSLRVNFIY